MSGDLFLSREEIIQLTAYKHKSQQKDWLAKQGIPFMVNRLGDPIVNRSYFTSHKPEAINMEESPNFGAI